MADLYRVARWLAVVVVAVLVVLLWPGEARAAVTVKEWQGRCSGEWYRSKGAAADASVGKCGSYAGCTGFSIYPHSVKSLNPGDSFVHSWAYCGTGQVLSSEATMSLNHRLVPMECAIPTVEVEGECVDPCAEAAGQSAGGNFQFNTGAAGTGPGPGMSAKYICDAPSFAQSPWGCVVRMDADFGFVADGMWWQTGPATHEGRFCMPDIAGTGGMGDPKASDVGTGDTAGPGETGLSGCPSGKVPGQVNGVDVCVTPGPTTPVEKKDESTNSKTNPDGSTVETSKSSSTSCDAEKCVTTTTTTTTTTTGGVPTTETTSEQNTCQRGSPGCSPTGTGGGGGGGGEEASSFGGACAAGFTCDGDAIMCAIAQEQHRRDCQFWDKHDVAEAQLYQASKVNGTTTGVVSRTVGITPGSFDSSNALGVAAQCLPDLNITVMDQAITLPISMVCPYLAQLGTILLALAWLSAAVLVGKGITA